MGPGGNPALAAYLLGDTVADFVLDDLNGILGFDPVITESRTFSQVKALYR